MQQAIGAVLALGLLLALIVGPVYLAVSARHSLDVATALCTAGDFTCEAVSPRRILVD